MHHKRRRPKKARAGCLLCKPHKANGAKGRDRRARLEAAQAEIVAEYGETFRRLADA